MLRYHVGAQPSGAAPSSSPHLGETEDGLGRSGLPVRRRTIRSASAPRFERTVQLSERPERSSFARDAGKGFSQASDGMALAIGFVVPIFVLWLAGRLIDGWLGIEPWAQVVGAVAGWGLGFLYVFIAAQRAATK
ncbi:MAG: AtpZ/AtpI family protein [Actinomycetota bacterium]|nr:AtpZ/AtpI family protein [Actinomycetota bacterium]